MLLASRTNLLLGSPALADYWLLKGHTAATEAAVPAWSVKFLRLQAELRARKFDWEGCKTLLEQSQRVEVPLILSSIGILFGCCALGRTRRHSRFASMVLVCVSACVYG